MVGDDEAWEVVHASFYLKDVRSPAVAVLSKTSIAIYGGKKSNYSIAVYNDEKPGYKNEMYEFDTETKECEEIPGTDYFIKFSST